MRAYCQSLGSSLQFLHCASFESVKVAFNDFHIVSPDLSRWQHTHCTEFDALPSNGPDDNGRNLEEPS